MPNRITLRASGPLFDGRHKLLVNDTKNAIVRELIEAVGRFTGDQVSIGGASAPLSDLSALYRGAFADTFA